MLIIILKILLSLVLSVLFFWCGNKINCMDKDTECPIRWAFILKRAGAFSLILALWTFDPFTRIMSLLLPIGITLLAIADRREDKRYEWCMYHAFIKDFKWKY